jgi:hypothetical protein
MCSKVRYVFKSTICVQGVNVCKGVVCVQECGYMCSKVRYVFKSTICVQGVNVCKGVVYVPKRVIVFKGVCICGWGGDMDWGL